MTAALASAQHHSASRGVSIATQTEAPVIDHAVPAPAVNYVAPAAVIEYMSSAPVFENVVPAPAVNYVAPAPVIEDMSSAPVIEYVAPAVTLAASSQQLPPAYTMTTVTTDDNFDFTDLVNTQFSIPAVELFFPQVVGSLPPSDEIHVPVYEQIHQEQVVAGMATQHRVENPAVQEQVIVQEISQVST